MKSPKLGGIVEADETYFYKSNKGSRGLPIGTARKRGIKSKNFGKEYPRGLSYNQACVLTALDRDGHYFNTPVGYGKVQQIWIKKHLDKQIKKGSTLVTDGEKSYKILTRVDLKQITGGITKNKVINIYRIGAYHKQLKDWMVRFNGVSTKYLDNYVNFFKAIKVNMLNFGNIAALDTCCRQAAITNKTEFKRAV
jgi:transposase-like protein